MADAVSTNGPTIISPIVVGGEAPPPVESPIVEGNAPAPEGDTSDTEGSTEGGEGTNTDPAASSPAATTHKTTPEWAQKRINELTAKRYEAERTVLSEREARVAAEKVNAELLARLSGGTILPDPNAANSTGPASAAASTGLTEEDVERRALEKAGQLTQIARFNEACNNVAETGKKEFGADWDDALKNLGLVGAIGQNVSTEFLETAIELKNPAKILYHLGLNIEEAERIAKLPPKRMAMEMARIEAQINAPVAVSALPALSNAPAPVIPVGGKAAPNAPAVDDPNVDMGDWMAVRAKQIEERRKRYQRA